MSHPFPSRASRRGFTLIELLIVIAIIAILASIVIIAVNPTRQLGSARNAQRHSDVNTLVNAVYQYAIDNNGLPATITTTETPVCKSSTIPSGGECVNLRMLTGAYLVNLPTDPQQAESSTVTGYTIYKLGNNRVTVNAPNAESPETSISVTR